MTREILLESSTTAATIPLSIIEYDEESSSSPMVLSNLFHDILHPVSKFRARSGLVLHELSAFHDVSSPSYSRICLQPHLIFRRCSWHVSPLLRVVDVPTISSSETNCSVLSFAVWLRTLERFVGAVRPFGGVLDGLVCAKTVLWGYVGCIVELRGYR